MNVRLSLNSQDTPEDTPVGVHVMGVTDKHRVVVEWNVAGIVSGEVAQTFDVCVHCLPYTLYRTTQTQRHTRATHTPTLREHTSKAQHVFVRK